MKTKSKSNKKKELSFLIYEALVEIRLLIEMGRTEQAADLARVYHSVPIEMWHADFCIERFSASLAAYLRKYPDPIEQFSLADKPSAND